MKSNIILVAMTFTHNNYWPAVVLFSANCAHVFYCAYFTPSDADELHVSNVTSSSLKLRWASPDPKLFVYFEVVVTRLHDHALVLKTNVSGTELSVNNLESAQTYHAVVTAHSAEGQIVSSRKGIITTSKSINTPTQICCKLTLYFLTKKSFLLITLVTPQTFNNRIV